MARVGSKWIRGVSHDDRAEDVAGTTLQTRLEVVQHYLPLAARKAHKDVEHVHQLRVSTRRAMAAVEMYEDLLPPKRARWLTKKLKRIRQAAGAARDDDVFIQRLEQVEQGPGVGELVGKLRESRREAQQPIVEVYERLGKSGKLEKKISKLLTKIHPRGENGERDPRFGPWAARHLRPVVESVFAAAEEDLAEPDKLHQLRIEGKRLRYAIELLAGAFPTALKKCLYPKIETLQEKLGVINDHAVAAERLACWRTEAGEGEEAAFLDRMVDEERSQFEAGRTEFLGWFTPERKAELKARFDDLLSGR